MSRKRIANIRVNVVTEDDESLPSYIKLQKMDTYVNGTIYESSVVPKEPMLARPVMSFCKLDKFLSCEGYENFVTETKYDGERVLCRIDNDGKNVFFTRTLKRMDRVQFSVTLYENKSAILDGERVYVDDVDRIVPVCDTGNRSNLRQIYIVFDIQAYDDRYVIYKNYKERREILQRIVMETENVKIAKSQAVESLQTLGKIYKDVLSNAGEGLIVKDVRVPYTPARRHYWIKLKPLHLVDHRLEYDLYAFRALRDKNGIYSVLECGYYCNDDGVSDASKFVKVCSVSSGLTDVTINRIKLLINAENGTFKKRTVVTITADKITNRGSLRHPAFLRFSFEKHTIDSTPFTTRTL